jgi:hypothetical protein
MSRRREGVTEGYLIADAQHMNAGAQKHAAEVAKYGVTDTLRKRMTTLIGEAIALANVAPAAATPLEEARPPLRDMLGRYRRSADLVARGPQGRDRDAEAALQTRGSFPGSDTQVKAYVTGIGRRMKPYAVKLAAAGFAREDQEKLVELSHTFVKALAARGAERGEARAERLRRDAVFSALKDMTSFFRRAGRAALYNSNQIADFNRVHAMRAHMKVVQPPAPAAAKS